MGNVDASLVTQPCGSHHFAVFSRSAQRRGHKGHAGRKAVPSGTKLRRKPPPHRPRTPWPSVVAPPLHAPLPAASALQLQTQTTVQVPTFSLEGDPRGRKTTASLQAHPQNSST